MDFVRRIDHVLETAIDSVCVAGAPPTLGRAMRHAVFPGGARIRPQLCLTVALACGDSASAIVDAAAAAIELMHCASLVHDDLPCFDDALMRRGQPSVHSAFGEPIAVLAGDQLIVLAFELIARASELCPEKLPQLIGTLARGVGMPGGIIAGQGWESERCIPVDSYRRAKTASLFEAAASVGALAAGSPISTWRLFGQRLGDAYQVADDIRDVTGNTADLGKPVGRDVVLGRPNTAARLGLHGSLRLFDQLVREALEAVPPGQNTEIVRAWVHHTSEKLIHRPRFAVAAFRDVGSGSA